MSGSEHARPVWLNRHDRYEIEAAMILAGAQQENGERLCPASYSTLRELLAAWDAAPADPVRTAMSALRNERLLPVRSYDDRAVHVVLRAIGAPSTNG